MHPKNRKVNYSFPAVLVKANRISNIKLHKKYTSKKYSYSYIIANNIIFSNPCSIVFKYKDFLLYTDNTEFIQQYYPKRESLNRIKKISLQAEKIINIFPNYIKLSERKLIYGNIFKKQKLINKINMKITHEKVYFRKPKNDDVLFTEDVQKELKEEENTLLNNYNLNSSLVSFANHNNTNNHNSVESFITNNESNMSLYNIVDIMSNDKIYVNDLQLLMNEDTLKNSNELKKKTLDNKKIKIAKKLNNNVNDKKENLNNKNLTTNTNVRKNTHVNTGINRILNTIQKKTNKTMKTTSKKKTFSKNKLHHKFITKPLLVSANQCTLYENKINNKNIYNISNNKNLNKKAYNFHMKTLSNNNIQKIISTIQQNDTVNKTYKTSKTNKTKKVKSKVKNIKKSLQINNNYDVKKEFQLPKLKMSNKKYLRHKHRSQDYGSKNILTEQVEYPPFNNLELKNKNESSKNSLKNINMKKGIKINQKNENYKENMNPNLITASNQNNYDNDDFDRANLIFCMNDFISSNKNILTNNNIDNSAAYVKTEQNFYPNNRYGEFNTVNNNCDCRNFVKHNSLSKKKSNEKNNEMLENKLKKQKTIKHMKNNGKENTNIKELTSFAVPSVLNNVKKDLFKKNISSKCIKSQSKNNSIKSSKEKNEKKRLKKNIYNLQESRIILSNHESNSKINQKHINTEISKQRFQNELIISEIKNMSQKYIIETSIKNNLSSEGNLYEKNFENINYIIRKKNNCDLDYLKNKKINQGILDRINSIKNRINNGFYKMEQEKNTRRIGKSSSIKEIGVNKNMDLKCNKSPLLNNIKNIEISNKKLEHKNIFVVQKKKKNKTYVNQIEHHDSTNTFESTGIIKVNKSKNFDKFRKELYIHTETERSHVDLNINK